jgi:ABC-type sugar transport system permease subunit
MNKFDDKLKRALENGKPIEFEREETLRQMMAQTFRSKLRWMVVFLWFEAIAVCVVAVWAGFALYRAQEMKPVIVYATVLIISAIFFVLVKVVGWQWVNKYSILREIKRLELQIAGLKEEK